MVSKWTAEALTRAIYTDIPESLMVPATFNTTNVLLKLEKDGDVRRVLPSGLPSGPSAVEILLATETLWERVRSRGASRVGGGGSL